MQRVIGIDFGTSTTYMNVKRYNGSQPDGDKFSYMPVMFNYGESSGYVATIVRENADGSFDFGEKASEPLEGSRVYAEIKMRLESLNEQERTEARRVTKEFFRFLYEQYAQQAANLGGIDDQEETVISYPVKWQKETARFMLDAAREAGFQNVRGMDEAEAAVATVLCQNSDGKGLIYADKPGYLMLIDMGAGTTDLVVCRYRASAGGEIAIELVASWPHSADEPTFGGREIDAVLEGYVETYLSRALNPALAPQAHVIATAPGQAKMWKERNVSVALAADKPVNTCAYIGTYKTMGMLTEDFPAFGRKDFEKFAESGLRDYARLVNGCLKQTAEIDKSFSTLDLVILTGGHSAWYFAKEILTGAMAGWLDHPALAAVRENPYRVVSLPNPQTTVSLGLVYSKLPFKLEKKPEKKPERNQAERESQQVEQPTPSKKQAQQHKASAVQVSILTVSNDALCYAKKIQDRLARRCSVRAMIDSRNIPFGQKLREAKQAKTPFVVYVKGSDEHLLDVDLRYSVVSVLHNGKDLGSMRLTDFEAMLCNPQKQKEPESEHKGTTGSNIAKDGSYRYIPQKPIVEVVGPSGHNGTGNNFAGNGASISSDHCKCPACGANHGEGDDFCGSCGASLKKSTVPTTGKIISVGDSQCPACGTAVNKGDEFCGFCGTSLKSSVGQRGVANKQQSVCPHCGAAMGHNAEKCGICGYQLSRSSEPISMLVSWYKGETKIGIAQATGKLTVYTDRLEFKRQIGNALTGLSPVAMAASAKSVRKAPLDIYWMRDIVDAKEERYGVAFPSLVITLRSGEKHTFAGTANGTKIRDGVDMIRRYCGR